MDVHGSLGGATQDDIRAAHQKDLEMQDQFGVRFLTYWFNQPDGRAFCLVEAPDADTAVACHKASHGLAPHEIIEVSGDAMAAQSAVANMPGAFGPGTTLSMLRWVVEKRYEGDEPFQKYHARRLEDEAN